MQSIHCPGQRTQRLVPYRASARHFTDCQIRSCDPPPATMVQLCLVIQEVWDDIPQARITHLSAFMSRTCRVLPEAHGLLQSLLTLLHLTVRSTEKKSTINFWLAVHNSQQIADLTDTKRFLGAVLQLLHFPLKLTFFVQYDTVQLVPYNYRT